MLKMFIDNEEVVSNKDFTIKEEMLNASSTILNNTYPKSWEQDKDYTSRFYYPKDYAKLNIQNHTLVQQAEAGTTILVNGSATLNDVNASKNSKVTKLLGQTSQTTIDGKNLFDKSQNYAFTNAPNTWTITQLDTGLRLKTSLTSGSQFVLYVIKDLTNYVGKTARLKCNFTISGNRKGQYVLGLCESDGSNRTMMVTGETSGDTIAFTIPSLSGNQKYLYVNLYAVALTGATANDYVDYKDIITTIDNADLTYVPYVGGVQSPNPSYPQDVHVVSGDNSIEVCGKNLVFSKIVNGSIGSTGNIGTNVLYDMFVARVVANKTYTITTGENSLVCGFFYDIPTTGSQSYNKSRVVQSSNKITAPITGYVAFRTNVNYATPQVEVGSTATNYEPYVSASYPIYLPINNLFDYSSNILDNANLSAGSNPKISSDNSCKVSYVPCQPNTTYTISRREPMASRFYVGTTQNTPAVNEALLSITNDNTASSITITTPANAHYIVIRFIYNEIDDYETYAKTIQVEQGSKANHFTPYGTTPIELCKIGTYQDSIYKGVGNNLFDGELELGSIDTSGNPSAVNTNSRSKNFVVVKPNTTYTITSSVSGNVALRFYEENETFISTGTTTTSPNSFTTPNNCKKIKFILPANTNLSTMVMFNEGSTSLPYEPYNAKDKWLLHKEIGKKELTTSDFSNMLTSYSSLDYVAILKPNDSANKGNSNDIPIFYSKGTYTKITVFNNLENLNMITSSGGYNSFYLGVTKNTTSEQGQSIVDGSLLYYPLATPTTTIITDETLISQLDALESS